MIPAAGWRDAAACVHVDPEIFYPVDERPGSPAVAAAKQVCATCPVRKICLADVMAWEDPARRWGITAGLTPAERAARFARERATAAALAKAGGSTRRHRSAVKTGLTPERMRRVVENDEFTAFSRRILRAAGRRIAAGDVEALPALAGLAVELEAAISDAVAGLRAARLLVVGDRRSARGHPSGRAPTLGYPRYRDRPVGRWPDDLRPTGPRTRLLAGGRAVGAAQDRPVPDQAARGRRRHRRRLPHRMAAGQGACGRPGGGWSATGAPPSPPPLCWRGCTGGAGRPSPSPLGVLALVLVVWRWRHRDTFEPYVGRWLRGWWWRWAVYARRMPGWLRACHLTVADPGQPVTVQVTPFRRTAVAPKVRPRRDQVPRVIGVRSGPSWDEVKVRLVPGQTPEDFDLAARALAVARGVARCQVRELAPDVVSIDYQRRDRLADVVVCRDLADLVEVRRGGHRPAQGVVRAHRVRRATGTSPWSAGTPSSPGRPGRGRTRTAGAPIVSIAPAIRDGLVRVSGIDPKGMELAYGRRIFHRYAVTCKDALALLDDLVDGHGGPQARVRRARTAPCPISREHPVELLEFDEIGALIRYVGDRKTREAIVDRIALLNTQGRALGLHRPRLRPRADQGHRPGPGAVPPPHLPARRLQDPRGDGARRSGLRPRRLGQPHRRIRSRDRLPVRRRHPRTPAGPRRLGAPTRPSRSWRPSSPAPPPPCSQGKCLRCLHPPRCLARPPEVRPDDRRTRAHPGGDR